MVDESISEWLISSFAGPFAARGWCKHSAVNESLTTACIYYLSVLESRILYDESELLFW
jgi:hypothetical protein